MTNFDLDFTVLRALARLSRLRKAVDCEALALRAGGSVGEVRGALRRLSHAELVGEGADGPRLTMMGLAVAVASGGQGRRSQRADAHRESSVMRRTLASKRRAA